MNFTETPSLLLTIFYIVLTFYGGYLLTILYDKLMKPPNGTFQKTTVILIIAHPDDECMFFGPTLLNLVKADCWIYVICLSSGNHDNMGFLRKEELRNSCKILGIPSGNVIIIEHDKLPDDPNIRWNKVIVGDLVLKYIKAISAQVVISFDQYGISKHDNHKSIYKGLRYLLKKKLLPTDCKAYALETTNIVRKYSSFLDVPMSYLAGGMIFLSSFTETGKIWNAMKAHKTQYVWFRKLYMLFSRYIYINSFKELVYQ